MSRRIESDDHNRWFVDGNNFSASFVDWVVKITYHIFYEDDPLESSMMRVAQIAESKWAVRFGQGDGGKWAHPIYCDTLEEAFELVDEYKDQVKFDNLMKKLIEDNNQSSDKVYSSNEMWVIDKVGIYRFSCNKVYKKLEIGDILRNAKI